MEITTAVGWGLLCLVSGFGRRADFALLLYFWAYRDWEVLMQLWTSYIDTSILIRGFKIVISVFIFVQVTRYILNLSSKDTVIQKDEFPVGPLLFPCRTDHARLVPTKHTFTYSYLFVGVPVRWKGNHGGMVSCDEKAPSWYMGVLDVLSFGLGGTGAWWRVNSDDYLGRGQDDGLQGKLRTYLKTQGVDPDQYAHAYLLTAARFLGYASNPVSIWHLYSADYQLKALVLEVNNTFDERHSYFLEPGTAAQDVPATKPTRYTGTWPKNFYVSTFNSRSGAYSLSALDPLAPILNPITRSSSKQSAYIDTTITLSLPQPSTKPMLVARVYSAAPPADPSRMSLFQKTMFLKTWWWVGFMTFPRTLVEAWKLFFRKKMPWVFIPQPRKDTMPARASSTEVMIEKQFRDYLRHVVQQSPYALKLRYIPAGILGGQEETMIGGPRGNGGFVWRDLEIRILTPLFYSRLIHYSSIHDGLLWERHSATLSISDPYMLSCLDFSPLSTEALATTYENIIFTLIATLRRQPKAIEPLADEKEARDYAESGKPVFTYKERLGLVPKGSWTERNVKGLSGLDAFVMADRCGCAEATQERSMYAPKALKMILADRLGFGFMALLDLEILVLRGMVAWLVVKLIA